jgi:hypothetical protein
VFIHDCIAEDIKSYLATEVESKVDLDEEESIGNSAITAQQQPNNVSTVVDVDASHARIESATSSNDVSASPRNLIPDDSCSSATHSAATDIGAANTTEAHFASTLHGSVDNIHSDSSSGEIHAD